MNFRYFYKFQFTQAQFFRNENYQNSLLCKVMQIFIFLIALQNNSPDEKIGSCNKFHNNPHFYRQNIVVNPKLRTSLNFGAKNVLLGPSVVNYSGVWPELLAPFAHQ